MVLTISELLSDDTIHKVANFYNSNLGKVVIYLNSRGGNYDAMEVVLDIINSHKNRTILVAYGCIASCAFELFFDSKCTKKLVGGCVGMYHQSKIDVTVNEKMGVCAEDRMRIDYMNNYMALRTKKICKSIKMTKQETEKIEIGNDLWFGVNRMIEFTKNLKPTL
jgi:ATP-dependent protease ClpP protease subunit